MPKFAVKLVWVLTLAFLLSATAVLAQIDATTTSTNVGTTTVVVDDQLQGMLIREPKAMPTQWGLWWKSAKEKLSILTTVNPVKKAEKQLQFAEERMKYAEYIVEYATDAKRQDWAQAMVAKANEYMEKIEAKKAEWQNDPEAAKRKLVQNIATHQIRREKIMDKLEEKLPAEKLAALEQVRIKAMEGGKRLLGDIANNPNLASSTKQYLQNVEQRIENQTEIIKQYRDEKKVILDKIKTGDESAKEDLKKLNEERKADIKVNVEKYKEAKSDLKEKAVEGDQAAKTKLKIMNKVENKVQNVIKDTVLPSKPAVKAKIQVKEQLDRPTVATPSQVTSTSN